MDSPTKYDIFPCTLEFYILDALWVEAKPRLERFRHSHEKWKRDMLRYQERYTKAFARALYDYLVRISFGEMRHACDKCTLVIDDFPAYGRSRGYACRVADRYRPESILDRAVEVFSDGEWMGSFGGSSWARIAEAAQMYGRVPDVVFVDHAVDLAHNSGLCFDKVEAGIFKIDYDYMYSSRYGFTYRDLLDAKRDMSPYRLLSVFSMYCSCTLKRLVARAKALGLTNYYFWPVYIPNDADALLYYEPVQWGDMELGEVVENDLEQCEECSEAVSKDYCYTFDGYYYCEECFDNRFASCTSCGATFYKEDMREVNDSWYCKDCFEDEFFYCDRCLEATPRDDMYRIGNYDYCPDCFYEKGAYCDGCGEAFFWEDLKEDGGGDWYCEACFEEYAEEEENEKEEVLAG